MIKLLLFLGLIVISYVLYRAGGMGKDDDAEPKWIPKWLRRSWVRDWIIPGIFILSLWLLKGIDLKHWWAYLGLYPLMGGALSTYWDNLFGYDNYYAHGFMVGFSTFTLFWTGIHWWAIGFYTLGLCASIGLWSNWIEKDWIEEGGRGGLIILLRLLLLL